MTTLVPDPGAPVQSGDYAEGPILPRRGEPGWSMWPRRVWPPDPTAAAPPRMVLLSVAAAVVGSAVWRPTVLSIGYLVVGLIVFGVVYGTARRRPQPIEWVGIATTVALLAVPAVLAAGWIGTLCIMAAWIVGWCTIIGGRTWTAVFVAPFVPWPASARVKGWLRRTPMRRSAGRTDARTLTRVVLVAAVTIALVAVFGGLFAAADPAFAHLAGAIVPTVDGADVVGRTFVFAMVFALLTIGSYLLAFRPRLDAMAPSPGRSVPTWEWAVPLAVLDALFVAFVAVQATVLFGGHTHVLETAGLTYAEYARQGFWQLLGVTTLTLVVLGVALRKAGRGTALDLRLIRMLIGILCATSIVIVISAIHRMWVYQQAYGFSVERLLVITVELWLGVVFVLIAACGIRMAAHWLPRAVLISGAVALLGLAALNPERLIADRNIDRYQQSGRLDARYLATLSSDIDPALRRLPDEVRGCIARPETPPDPWYEFNLSRSRASDQVRVPSYRSGPPPACEEYLGYGR